MKIYERDLLLLKVNKKKPISDLDINFFFFCSLVQEDLEHEFGAPLRIKDVEIKKIMTKKFIESLQNRMAQIVDERNWMLLNDYNAKEIKVLPL